MLKTFFIETGFFRKFKVIIKVLIEIILFCLASQENHCWVDEFLDGLALDSAFQKHTGWNGPAV